MRITNALCSASTLMLLVINTANSGEFVLSAQTLTDDKDLAPALLAIRALRASLATTVAADRVVIGVDDRVREDRDAAHLLMELGPARCRAESRLDAVAIDCRSLSSVELEQQLRYFEITGGWLGRLAREALSPPSPDKILVLGGGTAPLMVSVDQVSTAARLFDIDVDGFAIGGRYPTDEERSLGAGWVLEFDGKSPP